jgi:hypothetical protein
MAKGIYLTLMIGPAVPVPAPQVVMDALTSVQVTTTAGQTSGFQLAFSLSQRSPLHTLFLLSSGSPIPLIRVIIAVTVSGTPQVLMDGVMTNHQIAPGNEPGQATLTVTGEDLTRVMDYVDFSGIPYPGMPDAARVLLILAKYAAFGIVPRVIPSVLLDAPLPVQRIPRHKGTDLFYIQQLAEEAGYVFYLEPGSTPGASTAYWGPEIKIGTPQRALNVNMDAHTNVESLNFTLDTESKTLPVVFIQNEATKLPIPIPIPDITQLNPSLGSLPLLAKKIEPLTHTAKFTSVRAALTGLVKAARTADAVSASGSLDVLRYGRVLQARRLVGVRGAGPSFDGLYYVRSVTHNIKRGEYKQSFTLSRNGLLSTLQRLPV